MIAQSHISELVYLLHYSPMVTEEQAAIYIAKRQQQTNLGPIYRSIHKADSYKQIWREHIRDTILVALTKGKVESPASKQFPYAFWLYLAANNLDSPCESGMYPFCATFTRHRKDGSDRIAQVAVLDLKGSTLPLTLAYETQKYTKEYGREWLRPVKESPDVLPALFWRALILLNMPDDFLTSKDFEQLQGVGYSSFFSAASYDKPPELVAKVKEEQFVWGRFLGRNWD